jgi:hypothetical protein
MWEILFFTVCVAKSAVLRFMVTLQRQVLKELGTGGLTMKDRLIELLESTPADFDGRRNVDIIAKHLLENGVIVPPCKVGDTVYMLVTKTTTRFDFENGKMKKVVSQHTLIKETRLLKSNFFKVIETFGKTVFLTREEAEKALERKVQE